MLPKASFPSEIPVQVDDHLLMALSSANPGLKMERTREGNLIVMSPRGSRASEIQTIISGFLFIWNRKSKLGHSFGEQAGFRLPDASVLSPDISWISNEKWQALTKEQQKTFAPVCPDFIVEIVSPSDSLEQQHDKMQLWLLNGARLGWLIEPDSEKAWIYKPGRDVIEITGFESSLSGEDVLPGFVLELVELRD